MSTITNDLAILLFQENHKRAWNQFPVSSIEPKTCQRYMLYNTVVFDQISFWQYQGFKRNNDATDFADSVDLTKTKKSRYLENETFFLQIKKIINYTSRATLLQKIILQRRRTLRCETIFGNYNPFKNDEKCFLFRLKSSLRSQDI